MKRHTNTNGLKGSSRVSAHFSSPNLMLFNTIFNTSNIKINTTTRVCVCVLVTWYNIAIVITLL